MTGLAREFFWLIGRAHAARRMIATTSFQMAACDAEQARGATRHGAPPLVPLPPGKRGSNPGGASSTVGVERDGGRSCRGASRENDGRTAAVSLNATPNGGTPYLTCPDHPNVCTHGDRCPADVIGKEHRVASFKRIG